MSEMTSSRRLFLSGSGSTLGLALIGCGGQTRAPDAPVPELGAASLGPSSRTHLAFFEEVVGRARELAAREYAVPDATLPGAIADLDYDRYRAIRFRPERSFWRGSGLGWEAQLFHRGFLHADRVNVHLATRDGFDDVAFDPDLFSYPEGLDRASLPRDLGFSGFRLHAPFNRADYFDEVAAFVGASYFRGIGRGQIYGLSARAIAIDTGLEGPEEFPRFTDFWLLAPAENEARVFALLDGPSVAGAFDFRIRPGDATEIDAVAHLFFRRTPEVVGLAPLTSMYLAGETEAARADDFRPEVHDSDGLSMHHRTGERLWRPLRNPRTTAVSSFDLPDPRGFGLLQRDTRFESYQDLEALYHRRPSAWVEPRTGFGAGTVRLLEIPTDTEGHDNVVATFVPKDVGSALSVEYRTSFGPSAMGTPARGFVTSTRTARRARGTLFIVSFAGEALAALDPSAPLELDLTAGGATVIESRVEPNPYEHQWRAVFELARPERADESAIDLRAFLRVGGDALTETWLYPWVPV
jgi:periplasmic glucans biosynthesis protein